MAGKLRIYTVAEVNALLPDLRPLVERQRECIQAIEATTAEWRERLGVSRPDLRPDPGDSADVLGLKHRLRSLIAEFRSAWDQIEAKGGIVSDAHLGAVDFYGEHDGELVYLCWRLGEPRVAFWHLLDEEFGARKPLDSIPGANRLDLRSPN